KQLRQMANKNSEMSKLHRIERSVIGYDTSVDDIEIMDDQEDFGVGTVFSFDPYTIIRSGFRNLQLVDKAMLHLHLKGKFNTINNYVANYSNNKDQYRPAYESDDDLIRKWQEIIASRKRMEQENENTEKNYTQEFTPYSKNNK
ncbi:16859_t:CDS:2, partial [Cetraspora pellucida]